MVKITLVTSNPREVDIVSENMTVREFLEKHNVNYGIGSTSIDGMPLQNGGMDMSFTEHGITDRAIVACLPNKDNGAEVKIAGSAAIVISSLTPDDIKRIKKFHPEAMVMVDENGDPVFAIDIDEETPGSINSNGACFSKTTDANGKATITVLLDPEIENPKETVYEQIGGALHNLKEMEEHIAEVLPDLEAEENEIKAMITCI